MYIRMYISEWIYIYVYTYICEEENVIESYKVQEDVTEEVFVYVYRCMHICE